MAGYSSPIKLPIGLTPETSDNKTLQDQLPVYNSLHILNQYLDSLRANLPGGDPNRSPWDTFPITANIWYNAAQDVAAGDIVSPVWGTNAAGGAALDGYAKGAAHTGTDSFGTGFALTTAAQGTKVNVGFGSAVIHLTGVHAGDVIYAQATIIGGAQGGSIDLGNDGSIYGYAPANPVVIGYGVGTDMFMLPLGVTQ